MENKSELINFLLEKDEKQDEINLITERIIGCAYKVMNELGVGFLEKVYENALAYEIREFGLKVEQQKKIKVFYKNIEVGIYEPDLLVEDLVTHLTRYLKK